MEQKLYQGQKMKFHDLSFGIFSVVFDNKLIAIAEEEEEDFLRPKRVFKEKLYTDKEFIKDVDFKREQTRTY